MVSIEPLSGDEWLVTVTADTKPQHRVRVTAADRQRFGSEGVPARVLLEASFRFLLEREPNSAILPTFELGLISRYFPEYERELARYLANAASED